MFWKFIFITAIASASIQQLATNLTDPGLVCDTFCDGCTSKHSCLACSPGALFWPASSLCRDFCPLGSRPSADYTTCEATEGRVAHFDFTNAQQQYLIDKDSGIVMQKGELSFEDASDPSWRQGGGLEFSGDTNVKGLTPFVLPQSYTIMAWVNLGMKSDYLPIFSKTKPTLASEENIFNVFFGIPNVTYKRPLQFYFSDSDNNDVSVVSNSMQKGGEWIHISISVEYWEPQSIISMFVNGQQDTFTVVKGFFWDAYFYNYYIGYDLESHFDGIIREFEIYNYVTTDFSTKLGDNCAASCSACLPSNNCIQTCEKWEFIDDTGFCQECGDLCDSCSQTSSCMQCAYGAVPVAGTNSCTCGIGMGHNGTICAPCDASCNDCIHVHTCVQCAAGFLSWPSGICSVVCPTGYTSDGLACAQPTGKVFEFTFNSHRGNPVDNVAGYIGEMSFPSPTATRERGFYFSGQNHINLPPNRGTASGINLSTDFTITTWMKTDQSVQSMSLLGKFSPLKEIFNIYLVATTQAPFKRLVKIAMSSNTPGDYSKGYSNMNIYDNNWSFLSVQSSYHAGAQRILLSINGSSENIELGQQKIEWENASGPFLDDAAYSFVLGSYLKNGTGYMKNFTGFVKELSLFNHAVQDLATLNTSVAPTSLCPVNNFVNDDGSCGPCLPNCSSCVRGNDCSLCEDVHCRNCAGRFDQFCLFCDKNMTPNRVGACECQLGYFYDQIQQTCLDVSSGFSQTTS